MDDIEKRYAEMVAIIEDAEIYDGRGEYDLGSYIRVNTSPSGYNK